MNMNDCDYFSTDILFDHPELLLINKTTNGNNNDDSGGNQKPVRIFQKCDTDESGIMWDSSLLLAKYLEHDCYKQRKSLNNLNVLELGSGTGFLGIWCAALGARVLMTDRDSKLDLIRMNVEKNQSSLLLLNNDDGDDKSNVRIESFDWFDQTKYEWNFLQWKPLDQIDLVLISDCLYYEKGMLAIYDFIEWILRSSSKQSQASQLKILLSYEDRENKMDICRQFLNKIEQNDRLKYELINDEQLHPDYRSDDLHLLKIWS